ncbi:MAG TPA: hypothetical protein PLD25_18700 [Chloroflexota bacterium]|nr:hypothetical protein [Chloroflexota bacterium]HUM68843.1 hypothetical protein [Chloroflexota bacterium]
MRRLHVAFMLWLAAGLLLVIGVQAMSSANYQLNWFTPLTGSGGPANSAEYAADLTIGQSVIGQADSANYQAGLGYWVGIERGAGADRHIYLPVIIR